MAEIFWYNLTIEEVAKLQRTDLNEGLSVQEVKLRQREFGKNKLPEEKPLSGLRIFLEQFRSPLIYILVIAGIITLILRDFSDAIVIFGAVFLNTIVGFIQENKASQTLSALKKVVKHEAEVLREGNLKIVDSEELVAGDIIILNPGDKVPADGRIIECHELKINEMALTGEWLSAKKKSRVLPKETILADRDNMVYMGTIVEDGKGKAIITETGINTELGKVALMVRETREEKTPYQKKLSHFSKIVGIIIGVICFGIFIVGIATGKEFIEMFTTTIAVAVAAIPEGLPIAITVILTLGMERILKKKGLVRRLASSETLGSTSVICSDKTATLTEGRMKVDEVIGDKFLTLKAAVLTSEAFIENPDEPKEKWILRGRPTDKALLEAGIEIGINQKKEFEKKKIAECPFNPINKFAAALYRENGKQILYVCGAPEKILELSKLEKIEKENWEKKLEDLTQKGLRVVACASKTLPIMNLNELRIDYNPLTASSQILLGPLEIKDLIFAGFITLKDPIRPEVKEAMKVCRQAGMRPIIVTGDHKLTAKAVAEELGFKIKEENILEGKDLDKLSDEDFEKILDKIQIYARVEPKHKMRIISAWQKMGKVVAMTGDGINDAPALKRADIGVALGSGTEVAKETSDLILLNDSFSIIVAAVEEGRVILDNIRKVITYLFSDTFTEIILIGVSVLVGIPLPITAVQILWVNLIEDGLPNIALAFEPKEKDVMVQKPAGHEAPLLTREMKVIIFIIGLVTDLILLSIFFWLLNQNYPIEYLRTMIFVMLGIDSIAYVFCCKSLRKNLWQINIFSNRLLIIGWVVGIIALLAAVYLRPLNILLKTVPLRLSSWGIILGLGIINVILIEATKWYYLRKPHAKA
ncbi:MAG: HAD-IC family P-type ATPase [Patescibacteria group bacterium]|nr:HAD-IC family P-type ATPase [Patescibacteria group bacterium]